MGLRTVQQRARAMQIGAAGTVAVALLGLGVFGYEVRTPQAGSELSARSATKDGDQAKPGEKESRPPQRAAVKLGLTVSDPKAFQGYTLLNPMNTKTTYLIDVSGRVVKTWESKHNSMHAAYLLENGHLFRVAVLAGGERVFGGGPGAAGRLQEFGWDGELIWDYEFHNDTQYPHHDAAKMPNGNVLMIVWDKKTRDQTVAAGRKKELVSDYLLPDSIVEVKPTGKTTGEVVWEWHLWDHLVQDHDSTKANYGDVATHPELVDINFIDNPMGPPPGPPGPTAKPDGPPRDPAKDAAKKAEAEKLKTLGYVGTPQQRTQRVNPDWTHVNSVDYNPALDQIVVSVHEFSEIWIIDHSTTKAEAAGHAGGRSGRGGDLLYRWGNPRVYRAGTKADRTLFAQHNAQWIPAGRPGEQHMLVFNNGGGRPDGSYSSVDELVLPVNRQGGYTREAGATYGPKKPIWSYSAPKKPDFYAFFISGAQRLPNGNTLICSGPNGTLFEVTPEKELVWNYVNPVKGGFGPPGFGPGPGGPPPQSQLLRGFLQNVLGLSDAQKKELDTFQKTVDGALGKVLTDPQKKTLRERSGPGPAGFAAMPLPGQIMSVATQVTLKPTAEQKKELADLQKQVDAKLDKVLTADQMKDLKQMRADFARGGPAGGPPGGPGGPGGPPGGSSIFRAYRYGPDYPGLAGKDLKPGKTVEELQPKEPEKAKRAERAKETASR
jgi:hypothetical protein